MQNTPRVATSKISRALASMLASVLRWSGARLHDGYVIARTWLAPRVRATAERLTPNKKEIERLESALLLLSSNVDSLRTRVRELESVERPALAERSSLALNLTTKGLALKLARSGQDTRQIATTLGVPAGEVELLLKVQRLQSQLANESAAQQIADGSEGPRHGASERSVAARVTRRRHAGTTPAATTPVQ